MAVPSNKAKYPVRSHNQELSRFFIRITAASSDTTPTLTVNGGGVVASLARTGTGNWLVTLVPKFRYLSAQVNVQGTAYTGNAVCTGGLAVTNTIAVKIAAIATGSASNPTSEVVDIDGIGIGRTEAAT